MNRTFVVVAAGFSVGAAHKERAAPDGHHVERRLRVADAIGVGFHLGFALGFRPRHLECGAAGFVSRRSKLPLPRIPAARNNAADCQIALGERNLFMESFQMNQRLKPPVTCAIASLPYALAACLAFSALASSAAAQTALRRYAYERVLMGSPIKITLYAAAEPAANRAAESAYERIAELDQILSDYKADSELSKLSATAGSSQDVPLSPDLWAVLERSQRLAEETNGAFDVTVGPYVRLWRRGAAQ